MIILNKRKGEIREKSPWPVFLYGIFHGTGFLLTISLFFIILFPLHGENINDDFDLSVKLSAGENMVLVSIAPKRDKQIKGLSEEDPFMILSGKGVTFNNDGIRVQTDYIRDTKPEVLEFPYTSGDGEVRELTLRLEMTYVPCIISSGVCKFPVTIEREYALKAMGPGIPAGVINTAILVALFILAVIGLIFYIWVKKDIIFTVFLVFIFSGMLVYTFVQADSNGISQADLSRDIASTLCLSCIGLEQARQYVPVNRLATGVLSGLDEKVLITVFSAPWCGSCPAAKEYVKELCSLYEDTLSWEEVDISLPADKERFEYYNSIYHFKDPIPLPAIIVSVNKTDVFYGTQNIEENLIQLIKKGIQTIEN